MKNKLRELRAAREWSQSDLADQLGVSRQTVNAIETEKYDPSLPLAFRIAHVFAGRIEDAFTPNGSAGPPAAATAVSRGDAEARRDDSRSAADLRRSRPGSRRSGEALNRT